jgi:peroxiredoxin
MTTLATRYADKGVVWLAINTNGDPRKNSAFASQHALPYPILQDSGEVAKAYGAKTTPHMFIIDRNGKLAYAGGIDNDTSGDKGPDRINYVQKALDDLLSGTPVSTPETKSYGCGVKYAK